MINIVLHCPQIPPNTGNIIRLCANTGATLHLIHPLGFIWDDKRLLRSGLDYHEFTKCVHHDNWETFLDQKEVRRIIGFTTKSQQRYTDFSYQAGDYLLFGSETCGLPVDILNTLPFENLRTLPMHKSSRSLNLSNAVAVGLYEAWRQLDFQ